VAGHRYFFNFKFYAVMTKENFFNDEFLKHFKTGDEPNGFLKELQLRNNKLNA